MIFEPLFYPTFLDIPLLSLCIIGQSRKTFQCIGSSFQLLFIGYVQDWYSIHCKTRQFDGISARRARLGHFSPQNPSNTTYREMSGISIIEFISHFHISHKKKLYIERVGTFSKWKFSKSSKQDIPTFYSECLFMENVNESITLCFVSSEKRLAATTFPRIHKIFVRERVQAFFMF